MYTPITCMYIRSFSGQVRRIHIRMHVCIHTPRCADHTQTYVCTYNMYIHSITFRQEHVCMYVYTHLDVGIILRPMYAHMIFMHIASYSGKNTHVYVCMYTHTWMWGSYSDHPRACTRTQMLKIQSICAPFIDTCVLQCVAVRCSALQRVAACCSVLQCVAVRCSVL